MMEIKVKEVVVEGSWDDEAVVGLVKMKVFVIALPSLLFFHPFLIRSSIPSIMVPIPFFKWRKICQYFYISPHRIFFGN